MEIKYELYVLTLFITLPFFAFGNVFTQFLDIFSFCNFLLLFDLQVNRFFQACPEYAE